MSQNNIHSNQPSLGLWRATSLVVGNIVGAGVLMLPASLGVYGTLGLLGWMLTTVGSIALALVFARLSRQYPIIGGPYAYSREAFGEFIGFQMAWSYWVGTWASNAAIATAFVSYLTSFWPILAEDMFLAFVVSGGSVWLFTFVNTMGVRTAGILQVFAVVVKVVPLAAVGLFGVFYFNLENFVPINPSGVPWITALGSAAALTLFSFLGIESATIPAEDVIEPEKNIPRATVLGTLIAAVIYIWTMTVILGLIPPAELSVSAAPFADASRVIFGNWSVPIIAASAAASAFVTLNGWILLQGQIPLAAAQDKIFPACFRKVTKSGAPAVGLIISSLLMTGMLILNYQATLVDQFTAIVTFTTFAVLLPYLYSSAAELYFLCTGAAQLSGWRLARSILVALLAFLYTVVIVAGAGQQAVYYGMIFVFAGFPCYVWMKRTDLLQKGSPRQ
ncbi:MAG: amino acid permease [Pseudomonadota bacterium]